MRAMVLEQSPGRLLSRNPDTPAPGAEQVLLRVGACGVCRTDLHIVDGELAEPKLPLIPGHEIVGHIVECGSQVNDLRVGERIGVPWLGYSDGTCRYCRAGRENLCEHAGFTGYTLDGGYAEYVLADHRFCFRIPERYGDAEAAPLLCAGLIGYRSYRLAAGGKLERLGLYGFGGAAHILTQLACADGIEVYAFTRPGDSAGQSFARRLGAAWAGSSDELPPSPLDAAIVFAPVGQLVVRALEAVDKGGRVVCGGIYMSDIPTFPYHLLWEEREVRSVANLTREDGLGFMQAIERVPIHTEVHEYPLERANEALDALRSGRFEGAAVLVPTAPVSIELP